MIVSKLHALFLKHPKICTDTRSVEKKSLFFALKGANFDANKFVNDALKNGASYAIIDNKEYQLDNRFILVDDVLKTLQNLATFHREYLGLPILALTGSNGKTTTKELLYAVLSKKYKTVATKGNLNNHIGVPLTLLSMSSDTEFGIVEFGANHPKEIEFLANIAKPDYGLITNFGKAHLEGFGSFEGVINTKTELYTYLKKHHKTAFVNADDDLQMEYSKELKRKTIGNSDADYIVHLESISPFVLVSHEGITIKSNMIGKYNFYNIAFAVGVGRFFSIPITLIKEGIERYMPVNNRSQIIRKGSNTIILDAYNANPTSMRAALNNLVEMNSNSKYAFLGDMFELGKYAKEEHQKMVDFLQKLPIDVVFLLGENFNQTKIPSDKFKKYKDINDLKKSDILGKFVNSSILIKGSRGMKLEQLMDIL